MSQMGDTDLDQLTRTLTENFNVLADEVQLLSDRKTVLEHKLRFAHEQVCATLFHYFCTPIYFMMRHFSSRSGVASGDDDRHTIVILNPVLSCLL